MIEDPSLEILATRKNNTQTRISKPPCKQRCNNPIILEERVESENDIMESRMAKDKNFD